MVAVRVIPCLDVRDGRVVKGTQFVNLKDNGDPVELAANYAKACADEICVLDISASVEGRKTRLKILSEIAHTNFIPLTAGGGISSIDDVSQVLYAGADKVSVNSQAVEKPEIIPQLVAEFGTQCIVLAVDVKRDNKGSWSVFTHAGKKATGLNALEWIKRGTEMGCGEILLTSMDSDGRRTGYDLELLTKVNEICDVPLVASGGAGHPSHLVDAVKAGADAVLVAGILHDGLYQVADLKQALTTAHIDTRPTH